MSTTGTVAEWHPDDGWGVIDLDDGAGGCWAHFSVLETAAFWEPEAGEPVELDWEPAHQDGYDRRATRVWPAGTSPTPPTATSDSPAYRSYLTITFD